MGVPLCSLRHQTENCDTEMCQESLLSLSRVDAILPSNLRTACTTLIITESKRLTIENLLKEYKEPAAKQEFLELAAACEEAADRMDDCRARG